jgi:hypothetical protein
MIMIMMMMTMMKDEEVPLDKPPGRTDVQLSLELANIVSINDISY